MATAGAVGAQTGVQAGLNTVANVNRAQTLAQKVVEFVRSKLEHKLTYLQKAKQHFAKLAKATMQFNKMMTMMAKFFPIIVVFSGIIAVFTNLLDFVIMAIAWVVIAIIQVIYFILGLPPFSWVIFIIFFIVVDVFPFLLYTAVFLAIFAIVTLFCLLLAFLDLILGGKLKFIILCQNLPAGWYKTAGHQFMNKFSRGFFCSKPCQKRFYPDSTGTTCVKMPKNMPPYCPQAEVMRLYTGDGRRDLQYAYSDINTTRNLKYMFKTPKAREEMLLQDFYDKQQFLDKCSNPSNAYSMTKYDQVTMNVCANLSTLKDKAIQGLTAKDIEKMQKVCNQAFCTSNKSYPFCTTLTTSSSMDASDLLKKVVTAIVGLIVFGVTVVMILNYMMENR